MRESAIADSIEPIYALIYDETVCRDASVATSRYGATRSVQPSATAVAALNDSAPVRKIDCHLWFGPPPFKLSSFFGMKEREKGIYA